LLPANELLGQAGQAGEEAEDRGRITDDRQEEIRNPKQIQITKERNVQTTEAAAPAYGLLGQEGGFQ
jgi:hypothetical protein